MRTHSRGGIATYHPIESSNRRITSYEIAGALASFGYRTKNGPARSRWAAIFRHLQFRRLSGLRRRIDLSEQSRGNPEMWRVCGFPAFRAQGAYVGDC
jgi:hypothetical protein